MSDVPLYTSAGLNRRAVEDIFDGLPQGADERRSALDLRFGRGLQSLLSRVQTLGRIVGKEISLGYPNDGSGAAHRGNVQVSWTAAVATSGLGGAVTFAHNLGLPVHAVSGRGYNLPNVRWPLVCFTHGDRTGANAAPSAAANPAHSSLYFRLGDTVTPNTIQLRVHSNLTVSASEPLTVEVGFVPAVI